MGPTTGTYKENTNRLNREQNVYRLLLLKIQSTPDFETPTFLDMQEKINNFNNLYGKVSEEDATHLKICSAIKYVQTIESNIKNGTELTSMDKKICNEVIENLRFQERNIPIPAKRLNLLEIMLS